MILTAQSLNESLHCVMIIVDYVTRGSVILADIIVVVITWVKTYRQWQEGQRLKMSVSLPILLLRDCETSIFTSSATVKFHYLTQIYPQVHGILCA
jgi:hypothetical protein